MWARVEEREQPNMRRSDQIVPAGDFRSVTHSE
jgi:hypothetical protein